VFSRARNERFRDHDIFRRVFERVVAACIKAGLVGGEGFAVDASLIEADANKSRSIPGSEWNQGIDPQQASRAVNEYLATLDDAAYGAATQAVPKFVSPSESCRPVDRRNEERRILRLRRQLSHRRQVRIIMDVEASRAVRQAEVGASRTMIERTQACFGIKPQWLAGDTAYGSAPNPEWLSCCDVGLADKFIANLFD
jgi:hypothetical protein